jgi:hypothetical protein
MGKMIFTDLISAGMRPVWMFAGMRPAWMFAGLISAGMKPARVMVLAGICCAMINLEVTHAQAAHPISDAYTFTSENDVKRIRISCLEWPQKPSLSPYFMHR